MSQTHQFRFAKPDEVPLYREATTQLARDSWPEFMWHDETAKVHWHEFFERFAIYQSVMLEAETNQVVAVGHSFPLRWDHPLADLPEEGWDWVFQKAVDDNKKGSKLPPPKAVALEP